MIEVILAITIYAFYMMFGVMVSNMKFDKNNKMESSELWKIILLSWPVDLFKEVVK